MKLNKIETNDVTQFSDVHELALALVGKYLKRRENNFQISVRGNMCFIHAWGSCEVEIPSHFPFSYTDDLGEHFVDKNINSITITGKCQTFFAINI